MKNVARQLLVFLALLAAPYPAILADTLELTDGQLIDGSFVGGTRNSLRFQIDGRVEVFPIDAVLALTFSNSGPVARASAYPAQNGTVPAERSIGERIEVPAGTRLVVRLVDGISSDEDSAGSRFTAVLDSNLEIRGRVVAPRGSTVYGRLSSARRGGRVAGTAQLQLELTDVVIDDYAYPIVTGEFEVQGRSQGTAKKTLGGAVLGALIDGGDGAKKGAAAGFGLSLLTKGKQLSIPHGTLIVFRLRQPLTVAS